MAAQKPPQREFVIRVPKNNGDKRFSILKFNDSLNVDPVNWLMSNVQMAREDNKYEAMVGVAEQDYGEGSVYGRAAREEARRKKYGRRRKDYQHDNQPWLLSIASEGKERKLRSICEGGAGEFADYWVFLKAGDDFQAYKITNWYQFLPVITHKTLDSEQAEEKFQLRNKVMNQFALKAQIMQQLKEQDDERATVSKASSLLIKDELSSDDEDDDKDDMADGPRKKVSSKKKKRNPEDEKKRDKRQRVGNADDVAAYESEDGQDEGREYDYMSDSGSDTDREEKTVDEKVDEALVGVGDETGLKSLIDGSDLDTTSDAESLENEEEPEEEKQHEKAPRAKREKKKQNGDGEISNKGNGDDDNDSSDSDSDDPDSGNVKSVLFMQRKDIRKRQADDVAPNNGGFSSTIGNSSGLIQPAVRNPSGDSSSKRQKVDERSCNDMPAAPLAAHVAAEALDEDVVRRLLLRKPHTTKELLNKVKPRCGIMTKAEIVAKLAQILKKIEPYQFRQKVDNKEVLYFSLNQTA